MTMVKTKIHPRVDLRWQSFWFAIVFLILGARTANADEITLSMPPDPNALPVFVLQEKMSEWMPGDSLRLVANPAGDPSAMRAMMQRKVMDFALFNLVGGIRFIKGGMNDLGLVSPWVWRGIYVLRPAGEAGSAWPDQPKVLVAPGLSTPPHVVTQQAFARLGVQANFLSGGSGAVLMSQLAAVERAPDAVAAPEPLISTILTVQEREQWPQRWEVGLDPTVVLGGDIPLGALWQTHAGVDTEVRARLVRGLQQAAAWSQDPMHRDEAARIAAKGFQELFRQPIPEAALQAMLANGRVRWRMEPGVETNRRVATYLKEVFGIDTMPPSLP